MNHNEPCVTPIKQGVVTIQDFYTAIALLYGETGREVPTRFMTVEVEAHGVPDETQALLLDGN